MAVQTRKLKDDVEDPHREREVLDKVAGFETSLLSSDFLRETFSLIIKESKLRQRENRFIDTAGAAKMLSREKPEAAAAIAGELCAKLYNLEVIKTGIENDNNITRFLIMGKEPADEEGSKCSLIFSAPHKVGALFAVLKIFAEAGLNLTRIESVPMTGPDIHYAFFTDFQGSDRDPKVIEALEKVKRQAVMYKFLGCYKEEEIP